MIHILSIKEKQKGAAALIALIIMSTILLLSGTSLVLNSIDLNKSLKGLINTNQVSIEAESCIEDSLEKLSENSSFTGTINLSASDIDCTAEISSDVNPSYKIISVSSNNGEYFYQKSVEVDITHNPISIVQ